MDQRNQNLKADQQVVTNYNPDNIKFTDKIQANISQQKIYKIQIYFRNLKHREIFIKINHKEIHTLKIFPELQQQIKVNKIKEKQ